MNLFNTVRYLYLQLATEVQYLHLNFWYLYRVVQKTGLFLDQVTLQRLMVERRVICQKLQNFA